MKIKIFKASRKDKPKQFPSVRFYGNKTSYAKFISKVIEKLRPETFLEVFGGTGVVSYLVSDFCKVTYVDFLEFCCTWIRSLISREVNSVSWKKLEKLAEVSPERGLISRNFKNMYFEDHENEWLDGFMSNAWKMKKSERDIAISSLIQACIAKRPFGAFHRANLYFRKRRVKRSFNNWITWNRNFKELYLRFLNEIKSARKQGNVEVIRGDCSSISLDADVIYADPPFVSKSYYVDYLKLYHFVEGLSRWDEWEDLIDYSTSLKCLSRKIYPEFKKANAKDILNELFKNCSCNAFLFSWASDGYPEPPWILSKLKKRWSSVAVVGFEKHVYLRGKKIELLFIAHEKADKLFKF